MCDWLKNLFPFKNDEDLEKCEGEKTILNNSLEQCVLEKQGLEKEIEELKKQIPTPNPKEIFWNTKYPQATISYQGRWLKNYNMMPMDLRGFYQNEVSKEFRTITEGWSDLTDDQKAIECQKWVIRNITYVSDKTQFGLEEYWLLPQETLLTRKGDCDDGAILMANLMMSVGIPYWKIRLACADVYSQSGQYMGGHCFMTYLYESPDGDETKDKWVAMDWCFFADIKPLQDRPDYKDSILYGKGKVWFSWNSMYSFYKSTASIGDTYLEDFKFL